MLINYIYLIFDATKIINLLFKIALEHDLEINTALLGYGGTIKKVAVRMFCLSSE